MIEIITGFVVGYGLPMLLLKGYYARRRGAESMQQPTTVDRAA